MIAFIALFTFESLGFIFVSLLHGLLDFLDDFFVGDLRGLLVWMDGLEAGVGELQEEGLLHGVLEEAFGVVLAVEKGQVVTEVAIFKELKN